MAQTVAISTGKSRSMKTNTASGKRTFPVGKADAFGFEV